MQFKINIALLALVSIAISGCTSTAPLPTMAAASSVAAAASPVLTVISITKSALDFVGSKSREYKVRIRVSDADQRNALRMAFNEACQVTIGSVVTSEKESNNQQLSRNNVTNYSSCYVKSHKILANTTDTDGRIMLDVEVTVASSKIANRVIGESSSEKDIEGDQHANRVDTLNESHRERSRLLDAVLMDYPARAWKIEIQRSKTVVDGNGNRAVEIPFIASIDQDYMTALKETLANVGRQPGGRVLGAYPLGPLNTQPSVGQVLLIGKSSVWPAGWNAVYEFDDRAVYTKLANKLGAQLAIVLEYYSNGGWIHGGCWNAGSGYRSLISFGPTNGRVAATWNSKIQDRIYLPLNNQQTIEQVRNMTDIRIKITDRCR